METQLQTIQTGPKLLEEQRENLINDLALFKTYEEISNEYGVNFSTISHYSKTHKDKIATIRRRYVNQLSDVKFAHKRFRIEKLIHLLVKTEEIINKDIQELEGQGKGYNMTENTRLSAIRQAASLVNQVRVEMEGNQLTIQGNITHIHQDSDILEKALNIITGRIDPE